MTSSSRAPDTQTPRPARPAGARPSARRLAAAGVVAWLLLPAAIGAHEGLSQRCGTPERVDRIALGAGTSPAARPSLPNQLGSAHFVVHYGATTDTNYVASVRDAAELAYRVLIDTLSYRVPPSDAPAGGDGRTDIYVLPSLGGFWGVTTPENWAGSPFLGSYTSYIEIVDTLSSERQKVVTAHEYFHAIHIGYDAQENASFLEMISTWCEERVYPASNLYFEVLPGFFDRPHKGLFGHLYSNVPWMIYLTLRYGDEVLVDIMEQCGATPGSNPVAAHDAVLPGYGGSTLVADVTVFTLWNYFTGGRDDGAHYPDGAAWPEVAVEKRSDCMPFPPYFSVHQYETYGSNYFFFDGNGQHDTLRVVVTPEWFNDTEVTLTRFVGAARSTETISVPRFTAAETLLVDEWSQCDSVLVVTQKSGGTRTVSNTLIAADFPRSSPPSEAFVLVLDRDGCRRPFDGVGDDFAARDGQEQPWSRALEWRGVRHVQTDSIPADLSFCAGIVVVGGYDASGVNLSDAELVRLMAYMDAGGAVYLEGRRFGEWADPGHGAPTPEQSAFWGYFGATFSPGDTMSVGNVASWTTSLGGALGAHAFDYDAGGEPDDFVGELTPTDAETLAIDQSGRVRMTAYEAAGGSKRIHSTVLLGGSSGSGGSTREAFVSSIVGYWGTIVPALAVRRIAVTVDGGVVRLEAEVTGHNGQPLRFARSSGTVLVPLETRVEPSGTTAVVRASDRPGRGTFEYGLYVLDATGEPTRALWRGAGVVGAEPPSLALVNLYPNPSRGELFVELASDRSRSVDVGVYDVAGRRVWGTRERVSSGQSTLLLRTPPSALPSGVYFVRVRDGAARAERKLMILR